jgi:hypothetical protein
MNRSFRSLVFVCLTAAVVGACGRKQSSAPPVATPSVTINHDRAPAGSPIEVTYRFAVAPEAKFPEDYRVFVHVVDNDGETLWFDDHNPPTPTSQWKPGQTVEYSRTVFVPLVPYVGDTTVQLGLHSVKDQKRLPLKGDDAGQQSYKVAHLQLLPPTDNLFTVFKDGWHPVETSAQDGQNEWQWTRKSATLAFKNPKKDATFYLDLDSPQRSMHGPQQVTVAMGGQTVEQFTLEPDERVMKKIHLSASQMGSADLAELQIDVDKTFVPAAVSGGASKDPRELGVRVFHAFVDPR